MKQKETYEVFNRRNGLPDANSTPFMIRRLEDYCHSEPISYSRRDYYKIMLFERISGNISYADRTITVGNRTLVFTSAMVPYSWEGSTNNIKGYLCVFTETFITSQLKAGGIAESALFKTGLEPVLQLDVPSFKQLKNSFEQMLQEVESGYENKYDLLRSYVQIIVHTSRKASPPRQMHKSGTSFAKISTLFLELLERQFPIWSPQSALAIKNANEFAGRLGLHTNHLNKALREHTGKTTTEHISEYIVREAKALLLHSNWAITDIALCLGFNHVSNFNTFFKKHTQHTPKQFRLQSTSIS
jgi:AraC-like DNA-binding protein